MARALAESRLGKWDGSAYWGHKPEHDNHFLLSDNVLTEQWVFIYRKVLPFKWAQLSDLRKYRLGLITDYTYTPELWDMANQGKLKIEKLSSDQVALRMLILNRIDIAPMERNVACDLLANHFSTTEATQLAAYPKLMTENFTTHLMLPRSIKSSPERIAAFNSGLKKLRASGEYEKLLGQVNCPNGWSNADKNN